MILLSLQNSSTYRPWPVPLSWANGVPIQQNCFILTSWYHFPGMVWTQKRYCRTTKPRSQGSSSSSLKFQIEPFSKFQNCDFFWFVREEWMEKKRLELSKKQEKFWFSDKGVSSSTPPVKIFTKFSLPLFLYYLSLFIYSLYLSVFSQFSLWKV